MTFIYEAVVGEKKLRWRQEHHRRRRQHAGVQELRPPRRGEGDDEGDLPPARDVAVVPLELSTFALMTIARDVRGRERVILRRGPARPRWNARSPMRHDR